MNEDLIHKHIQSILEEVKPAVSKTTFNFTDTSIEEKLSHQTLALAMKSNIDVAVQLPNNDNRIFLNKSENKALAKFDEELGPNYRCTGFFWYPPGSYCGWHTNADLEGERTYFVWSPEDGKSFFRYYDAENKTIVTEPERKGVTIRKFSTSKQNPFWHSVGSYTNRISIGYMEIKND